MNEILADTEDGTIKDVVMASNGDNKDDTVKTGRIYYPFLIVGKSQNYKLEHLPSGMTMGAFKWKTLKEIKIVIEELRQVYGCEDADPSHETVSGLAVVLRDNTLNS